VTRYVPSRHYRQAGSAAFGFGLLSIWFALSWPPVFLASGLFFASAAVLIYFAFRPPIEIRESHLSVGRRKIPWMDIRRLDRTGWLSPLVLHLTLFDNSRVLIVYPGDVDSANSLLRQLRRSAREALIDGIPYRQFWGEPAADARPLPSPVYRLLRPEDEAEVERLYQRLKAVRHLDPDNSPEEE
jgi:hypothetical protein